MHKIALNNLNNFTVTVKGIQDGVNTEFAVMPNSKATLTADKLFIEQLPARVVLLSDSNRTIAPKQSAPAPDVTPANDHANVADPKLDQSVKAGKS